MKHKKKPPIIRVSLKEYKELLSGEAHSYKTKLTRKAIKCLPPAYEDVTGTMLIFPKALCPKRVSFRPRWLFWKKPAVREVVNVMAFKEEDMSETLRFLLK